MTTEPGAGAAATAPERALSWLRGRGHLVEELIALPGDVSPRRYFRILGAGGSRVLAVYPPEHREACARWRASDRLLTDAGVRVPETIDSDCETGFVLLEDLGPRTLQDLEGEGWTALEPWLAAAADTADRIRRLDPGRVGALQPPLDARSLRAELDQTWRLVLEPRGLTGGPATASALRRGLDDVVAELAAAPAEPCHRDFMARNLVPLSGGIVAVLDHQDLRPGPPFYDLASLFNDTLYPPADLVESLLGERLAPAGARLRYHRAAAQRALKIAGTFEAFRRRGHARHVRLIRPSLDAALRHLAELPETAPLVAELRPLWSGEDAPLLD